MGLTWRGNWEKGLQGGVCHKKKAPSGTHETEGVVSEICGYKNCKIWNAIAMDRNRWKGLETTFVQSPTSRLKWQTTASHRVRIKEPEPCA